MTWSYLKLSQREWLVLELSRGNFLCHCQSRFTAARMIDQGQPGDQDKLYYGPSSCWLLSSWGTCGRIVLAYAAGKLTTNMVKDMRNDVLC